MSSKRSDNQLRQLTKLWFIFLTLSFIVFSVVHSSASTQVSLEWNQNNEPDLAGYRVFCREDGKSYNYTNPVWEGSNNYCTIYNVDETNTCYFVVRAFNSKGFESGDSNEARLESATEPNNIDEPKISSLSIGGDNTVIENSRTSYIATAHFSDGSSQVVTSSAIWSENSLYASIDSGGVLVASEVSKDRKVTIHARYTISGKSKSVTKVITIIDIPPTNLPPNLPNIVYPEMGQDEIEFPLVITTEPYSDPNNDSHSRSQWQISERSDFSACVVDVTGNKHLTTFSVPHMVMKSNHTYYVRVRFFDAYSTASNWSGTVEFSSAYFVVDLNANGISDTKEVDDTVDFNLDGIPDNYQPQIIKCIKSSDGSVYVGIEKVSSSVQEIESLEVIDPDTINDMVKRPEDLIFGLFAYRLRVANPGDTAAIRMYFSGEIFASDVFFKYDTINGWYDYSEHTTYNDDGQSITLEVKDGGFGDSDGLPNGVIVDPGGIASGSDIGINAGMSGGGGCFLATAAFGSKYENHVQLLRRFRDLFLLPNRIGRAFVEVYYRYSPPMANYISEHDGLRKIVRYSLIPLLGMSWLLLHFGGASTLLFLFMIGFTALFCYRKMATSETFK